MKVLESISFLPAPRLPRSAHRPSPVLSLLRRRLADWLLLSSMLFTMLYGALAQAALPIEHWTTAGGARVYFVRADAIPMLDVNIDLDAGARFDPRGREGLASLTQAMLSRGIDTLDEAAIAEAFARIGAQRGGGVGDDRTSLSLRTLTSEAELRQAVSLLTAIIARPSFPANVLAREKERVTQAIRESESKPETIVQRTFGRLLYPQHPYGDYNTVESINAISRDDLLAFHKSFYGARRAVVSMIGAITRQQAEAIAEQLTAGLPPGDGPTSVAPVERLTRGIEQRIDHPATQSHILIGQPAIARGDADFFPLFVGNYVLGGGGFVSRLYNEVREKRGLAYSVYSYFAPQLQPGPFTVGLQTQKEQTDVALGVVRETLTTFLRNGPTATELRAAKDNLIGGFPLRIDSNRKILDHLSLIGFYRLPLDYLDRWTERVEAVTLEQVRAAFARHVQLDTMVTVVVGAGTPGSTPAGAGGAPAAPGAAAGGRVQAGTDAAPSRSPSGAR